MQLRDQVQECINKILHIATVRNVDPADLREICNLLQIPRMYYDMDFEGQESYSYRDRRAPGFGNSGLQQSDRVVLFDSGETSGERFAYTFFYRDKEYVHAYIELKKGIRKEEVDAELYEMTANLAYLVLSRQNMRLMLEFTEATDVQTGIPNSVQLQRKYAKIAQQVPSENIMVLYINLQNFKYVNEVGGARCGDEVIVQYARTLVNFVTEEECVCRMGGDNFVAFILKEHFDEMLARVQCVRIENLQTMPDREFEISPWIGISEGKVSDRRPFGARLEEAATACNMGKRIFKKNVMFFSDKLMEQIARGHEIIAMFHPAVKNHEFHPFFQAKVDMRTGELVGFEALCRWIHAGGFIYPDQFIPVLDREGLIHELDMAIFEETCRAIRRWKDMGLKPPRISSNFSRKNLYVADVVDKICRVIGECGIQTEDVEIEITESVSADEQGRLIGFIRQLKDRGLHIAVDDFGTGYSSMALIHSIDADVLKIDKSFVDEVSEKPKSKVLIESIISLAKRLDMSVIAEGIETVEQGQELLRLGCPYAQGYYYSRPVDFEAATELIRTPHFPAICS